jgi:hypothetical protein
MREMKKASVSMNLAVCLVIVLCGCESSAPSAKMPVTGFLSDYSHLEPISDTSYRYVNPKYDLGNYEKFIIDPVEVLFDYGTQAEVKNWDEVEQLRTYMRRAIEDAIWSNWQVVSEPGPQVARVRTAITNVKRASAFRMGGASMEMELLDTQTGEQIGALVESQKKGRPLGEYYKWENAKAIIDGWARRFYNRLKEAHGY